MNSVNLHGHLAADPQAVAFDSGAQLTRLRLAVRRARPSNGEEASPDFFDVQAWGSLGRAAAEHLSSGSALAISGRLRQHAAPATTANAANASISSPTGSTSRP